MPAEETRSYETGAEHHLRLAEREVAIIPDLPPAIPTQPIDEAAVIGCGTMGVGIAMCFASAGIPIRVLELDQKALDGGLEAVRQKYASAVGKGRLSRVVADACLGRIRGTVDDSDLSRADIVIEAVFEEMTVKREVFERLDEVCKPEAILASNTSTLDVNEIAATTSRPESVIGTHFFSPAHIMRLMEIVRGKKTSERTLATALQLSRQLGKVGVVVGVCDGFVGNRMLHAYARQANFLLEEGATPQQVDRVIQDFGFPRGPFAVFDLVGLDVGWRIRKRQAASRPRHLRYSPIADRICELGRFGQKTGAGWYRYDPASRVPIPDPEIEKLIVEVSDQLGIERREISDRQILERCLYPLINEGAKILEEGLALGPGDIDVIWLYGYGFPRHRGGPMFYGDTVGLQTVYDVMSELHALHGELLQPASLLAELARDGKKFSDLSRGCDVSEIV